MFKAKLPSSAQKLSLSKNVVSVKQASYFVIILFIFLFRFFGRWFGSLPLLSRLGLWRAIWAGFDRITTRYIAFMDRDRKNEISRVDVIELAIQNMKVKKVRTVITIGGMMIGICSIVFLVSIGYGLQQLVIQRVARLEEIRQADVSPQPGGKVVINDKTLADFTNFPTVESALPLIAVVGRVTYQSSVSDVAVFGVTSEYLEQSAIKPARGKVFESNEISTSVSEAMVDEEETEPQEPALGNDIGEVDFNIDDGAWIRVRAEPSTDGQILGYTKFDDAYRTGMEVWGEEYASTDNPSLGKSAQDAENVWLGRWVRAEVPLWKQQACAADAESDCTTEYVPVEVEGEQSIKEGYFAEIGMTITGAQPSPVKTTSDIITDSQKEEDEIAEILATIEFASQSAVVVEQPPKQVPLGKESKRLAVVNRAFLNVLGLKESEAIDQTFTASFVIIGGLLADVSEKVESVPAEYTIIGITPDDETPIVYVPFIDLRSMGIQNYSQVKITVEKDKDLPKIRQQIEAMGFATRSVADTVAQINTLFGTLRLILALLGLVALSIAALGMFNTLTVSLLERTREVGLLKAMGMRSDEVRELFLAESVVMGAFGGIGGLIAGFLLGKLLGIILSLFSLAKGEGMLTISYIPFVMAVGIVLLSLTVGVLTGLYPSKRATRISALDALRYE